MTTEPPALRIAARPFTSPCHLCADEIPEELNTAVFALADDHTKTVCDTCARRHSLPAFQALTDLRMIDRRYWTISTRRGPAFDPSPDAEPAVYLRTLIEGAAALMSMYLSAEQARDTLRFLGEVTAGLDAPR